MMGYELFIYVLWFQKFATKLDSAVFYICGALGLHLVREDRKKFESWFRICPLISVILLVLVVVKRRIA